MTLVCVNAVPNQGVAWGWCVGFFIAAVILAFTATRRYLGTWDLLGSSVLVRVGAAIGALGAFIGSGWALSTAIYARDLLTFVGRC